MKTKWVHQVPGIVMAALNYLQSHANTGEIYERRRRTMVKKYIYSSAGESGDCESKMRMRGRRLSRSM
jgi:hypothetical protein